MNVSLQHNLVNLLKVNSGNSEYNLKYITHVYDILIRVNKKYAKGYGKINKRTTVSASSDWVLCRLSVRGLQ
jgi:hypothetical protein